MLQRSRLPFLNPHILLPLSNHALTWRYALRCHSLVAARSLSSVDSVTPWTAALWLRCPSVFPRVCSDSGPLSQWWHPTIQQPLLSASPPALSLSQHQVVFSSESALHQVAQVLELQLQHQSFQWIFGVDVLYDWLVWSPCCSRDFRFFSSTTIWKRQFFGTQLSLWFDSHIHTWIHDYWKNHSFNYMGLCLQGDVSAF